MTGGPRGFGARPRTRTRGRRRLRSRPVNQVIEPTDAEALDAIPVGPGPGRTLGIVAAWIVVGLIAGLALWLFWTHVIDPSGSSTVDSYAAGNSSQLYSSARDQFKVELPTTPVRREQNGPGGTIVVVESRPGPGYAFSVTREPQPETALENYTATLDTAAGSLATQVGGEIVSQTAPVPFVDVAVKNVVFRKGNEYYRNRDAREGSSLHDPGHGEGQRPGSVPPALEELLGPRPPLNRSPGRGGLRSSGQERGRELGPAVRPTPRR